MALATSLLVFCVASRVILANKLYCACALKKNPACMLFSNRIDSLAAAGAILSEVWVDDVTMPVVDSLGDEFLNYVKDGMKITIKEDGIVEVE